MRRCRIGTAKSARALVAILVASHVATSLVAAAPPAEAKADGVHDADVAAIREAAVEAERAAEGEDLAALRRWINVDPAIIERWERANRRRRARAAVFTEIGTRLGKPGQAAARLEKSTHRRGVFSRPTFAQLARGVVTVRGDEARMLVRATIDKPEHRSFRRVDGRWMREIPEQGPGAEVAARRIEVEIVRYDALTAKLRDGSIRTMDEARRELDAIDQLVFEPSGDDDLIRPGSGSGFGRGGDGKGGVAVPPGPSPADLKRVDLLLQRLYFETAAAGHLANPDLLAPTPEQAARLAAARKALDAEEDAWAAGHARELSAFEDALFELDVQPGELTDAAARKRWVRRLAPHEPAARAMYDIYRRGRLGALKVLTPRQRELLVRAMLEPYTAAVRARLVPLTRGQLAKLDALYVAAAKRLPDDAPGTDDLARLGNGLLQAWYEDILTDEQREQFERAIAKREKTK